MANGQQGPGLDPWWDNLRWERDVPILPWLLVGLHPTAGLRPFLHQGWNLFPRLSSAGGVLSTPSRPTSAMAPPLDSAPQCTPPLGWGTAPFWAVEMPETGEPHASPCGDPRTEGYDAVLRELKALTHTLIRTRAWPTFSSRVTWRIPETEK